MKDVPQSIAAMAACIAACAAPPLARISPGGPAAAGPPETYPRGPAASFVQTVEAVSDPGRLLCLDPDEKDFSRAPPRPFEVRSGVLFKTAAAIVDVLLPDGSLLSMDTNTVVAAGFYTNGIVLFQAAGGTWHRLRPLGRGTFFCVQTPVCRVTAAPGGGEFGVVVRAGGGTVGGYACADIGTVVVAGPRAPWLPAEPSPRTTASAAALDAAIPMPFRVLPAVRCPPPPEAAADGAAGPPAGPDFAPIVRGQWVVFPALRPEGTLPAGLFLLVPPPAAAAGVTAAPQQQPDRWQQRNRQLSWRIRRAEREFSLGSITAAERRAAIWPLCIEAQDIFRAVPAADAGRSRGMDLDAARRALAKITATADTRQAAELAFPGCVEKIGAMLSRGEAAGSLQAGDAEYIERVAVCAGVVPPSRPEPGRSPEEPDRR